MIPADFGRACIKCSMVIDKQATLRELQRIPSIGKACAYDLWNLGVRNVKDLKGKNPQELYEQLNQLTGVRHDICMLYTFRCAIYFASTKKPESKKLQWWYWKGKMLKVEAAYKKKRES